MKRCMVSLQENRNLMKMGLFVLSMVPAIAFATTPFDGTWKVKLDSMQYSGKPTEDVALINGSYTCKSCVPPFTVKADGKDQPTPVHNTRDHLAVKVISPTTVEYTQKAGGKVTGTNTDTVSAVGNTLSRPDTDFSGVQPY